MNTMARIVGTLSAATLIAAVAVAPANAEPAVALLRNNQLISFDTAGPQPRAGPAAPQTVTGPIAVTGLGAGQTLRGIDFRPSTGQLFGVAVATGSAGN